MLVWPTLTAFGFLVLNGLVIVLGVSSTSRFQFGGNLVQDDAEVLADVSAAAATAGSAPVAAAPAPGRRAGATSERRGGLGVAAHPAGTSAGADGTVSGWWLVTEPARLGSDESSGQVLAGPFPDRVEAEWAALSDGLEGWAVYGTRRPGRGLVRRPSPDERAWLSELSEQLDRLADDRQGVLTASEALTTLAVEVAAALVEAGLSLHDCARPSPSGGVCLTAAPDASGIVVSWERHDRMSLQQVHGARVDAGVQRTMNAALADLLEQLGFSVTLSGPAGCPTVHPAHT